jgi:hypothetical protein
MNSQLVLVEVLEVALALFEAHHPVSIKEEHLLLLICFGSTIPLPKTKLA